MPPVAIRVGSLPRRLDLNVPDQRPADVDGVVRSHADLGQAVLPGQGRGEAQGPSERSDQRFERRAKMVLWFPQSSFELPLDLMTEGRDGRGSRIRHGASVRGRQVGAIDRCV